MSWALFVILAVPLVAVLVSVASGWRAARVATLTAGLVSFGLAIALAFTVEHGQSLRAAGGWLRIDSLGAVFLATTGLLYATAAVFSIGYLHADEREAAIDRQLIDAYTRAPQEDLLGARDAARALIAAEPWD